MKQLKGLASKKMVALILTAMMASGMFAGCSGSSDSATSPSSTGSTPPSSTADGTSLAALSGEGELIRDNIYKTGDKILKEKQTYTIAVTKDPNSQNGFADKQCVKDTNALTNVDIDWMDIPAASWDEQVNIMIAAENLPDAFCGKNVDIMPNLEMFTPIGDYVEALAPHVKEMLDTDTSLRNAITAPDGKIYSFPTNKANPSNRVNNMLWMNPDWLEKIGKEAPTTTDEFVEVLRLFQKTDLNGNGNPNDEIPLVAWEGEDEATNLHSLIGAFDVVLPKNYVYSKDGETVVFGGTQEGLLPALQWLNMLYKEKLLDNEVFTMDNAQINAKAQATDLLMGSLCYWIPDSMDKRYADYIVLDPLKGPDGGQLWTQGDDPLGASITGFTVTKACKDPEALVRYYDTCMRDMKTIMEWQWGPENGGMWKPVGDDGWTQTQEFVPEGTNLTFFKRTICGSIYSPNFIWQKYAEKEVADPRNQKKREAAQRMLPFCAQMMPQALYDPDLVTQRNLLYADIDNYMKKFFATSVVNGITDAQWQEHLENCKKMRVEEYTQFWQDFYDAKKA